MATISLTLSLICVFLDMAKSVSIPIALSELKRASLQRLSTRRSKKKDKPLNGFVIFVQETDEHVKLFGKCSIHLQGDLCCRICEYPRRI